ncbi:Holliday junction branch migration protein RuvA [Synechococcus sp. GFB01]|uniref:Holliday junction branch migration protein RuvA n=1 Tax=Synechococcus sp. GFB01 TaxID=1662190 RepID=UPI00064F30D5|nr:Holliday junction branch migration protein RuvA [Synechococcus sp. GFB01]KMM17412.1 ATP-dependent DNA helicase RuvA [Synechococcus sp. GFB01]
MIGWLQGELADPWQQDKRQGLLLICQGVGYEVQVSQRQWQRLPGTGSRLSLWIHHAIRDDGWTLYGFDERRERDLFRELVAVSGVGPQMALGLLGAMGAAELVQAIVRADLRSLAQAPGVGKRTAERLAVELRSRLEQRWLDRPPPLAGVDGSGAEAGAGQALPPESLDEVQLTLTALGYEPLEIRRALESAAPAGLGSAADAEVWIRACLQWLGQQAA